MMIAVTEQFNLAGTTIASGLGGRGFELNIMA